jgi:NADPH2 dehydrogenase
VSSGGIAPNANVRIGPGYQVPFAAEVRRRTGLPVLAVGLIVRPEQAERIVAEGEAEMVALARAVPDEPHWAWHAARELGAEVAYPRSTRVPPRRSGRVMPTATKRR